MSSKVGFRLGQTAWGCMTSLKSYPRINRTPLSKSLIAMSKGLLITNCNNLEKNNNNALMKCFTKSKCITKWWNGTASCSSKHNGNKIASAPKEEPNKYQSTYHTTHHIIQDILSSQQEITMIEVILQIDWAPQMVVIQTVDFDRHLILLITRDLIV